MKNTKKEPPIGFVYAGPSYFDIHQNMKPFQNQGMQNGVNQEQNHIDEAYPQIHSETSEQEDLNVQYFCQECGTKVKFDQKFCPECGTYVKDGHIKKVSE